MPGPEGPAHRGWLGVVTGIRFIHITAAATAERHRGFLVFDEKFASPLQRRSVGGALRCMAERVNGSNETDVYSVVVDITGRLAVEAAETASNTGHWTLDTV